MEKFNAKGHHPTDNPAPTHRDRDSTDRGLPLCGVPSASIHSRFPAPRGRPPHLNRADSLCLRERDC
jgi:hypothetical protein